MNARRGDMADPQGADPGSTGLPDFPHVRHAVVVAESIHPLGHLRKKILPGSSGQEVGSMVDQSLSANIGPFIHGRCQPVHNLTKVVMKYVGYDVYDGRLPVRIRPPGPPASFAPLSVDRPRNQESGIRQPPAFPRAALSVAHARPGVLKIRTLMRRDQ